MADVYEAADKRLGRRVALKVLPKQFSRDPQMVERFEREVRAAASLNHNGIVTIFEVGQFEDNHFYSMRLLRGGDLRSRLRIGIGEKEALRILREVSEAFGHAHAHGFVHRDVKPENILFDDQGRAVLTDFGIAKAMSANIKLTQTGISIGTPRYIAPEQARGKEVDQRADLYSLGVILYEMLVGRPPYESDDAFALMMKHIADPIPRLPASMARYQRLVDSLMAKDAAGRPASCTDLISLIDPLLETEEERALPASPLGGPLASSPRVESKRGTFLEFLSKALRRRTNTVTNTRPAAVTRTRPAPLTPRPAAPTVPRTPRQDDTGPVASPPREEVESRGAPSTDDLPTVFVDTDTGTPVITAPYSVRTDRRVSDPAPQRDAPITTRARTQDPDLTVITQAPGVLPHSAAALHEEAPPTTAEETVGTIQAELVPPAEEAVGTLRVESAPPIEPAPVPEAEVPTAFVAVEPSVAIEPSEAELATSSITIEPSEAELATSSIAIAPSKAKPAPAPWAPRRAAVAGFMLAVVAAGGIAWYVGRDRPEPVATQAAPSPSLPAEPAPRTNEIGTTKASNQDDLAAVAPATAPAALDLGTMPRASTRGIPAPASVKPLAVAKIAPKPAPTPPKTVPTQPKKVTPPVEEVVTRPSPVPSSPEPVSVPPSIAPPKPEEKPPVPQAGAEKPAEPAPKRAEPPPPPIGM